MAQIPDNSETAKHQRKIKRLAMLYNLDRLDVDNTPLHAGIDIMAIKGDQVRHASINQDILDWRSIEHVVSSLFQDIDILK